MSDDIDDDAGDYEGDQLQPEDTLEDQNLDDVLDRGYSPPDRAPHDYGQPLEDHESLDERLSEEVPDQTYDPDADTGRDADYPSNDEVGDRRAGRLVAPDEGAGEDVDAQLLASDSGIDGAGASAEEAAVHVIDDE